MILKVFVFTADDRVSVKGFFIDYWDNNSKAHYLSIYDEESLFCYYEQNGSYIVGKYEKSENDELSLLENNKTIGNFKNSSGKYILTINNNEAELKKESDIPSIVNNEKAAEKLSTLIK